jgi:hypothetical protein
VSAETEAVVEFFSTREEADATLHDCLTDEPGWARVLRVEAVDFSASAN